MVPASLRLLHNMRWDHHTLVSLDGHVHVRVNVCAVRLHHNRQIHVLVRIMERQD